MPARRPTKPSTPRLSELARHVVVPKGAVSTGWPAVCKKCADLGISFRPWQDNAGKIILAKRKDGTYASTIGGTGLSIPRQVGKTFLVGAIIFALCILIPKLTVIWTAHRLRTAEETFGKMQVFAKRRLIRPHVLKIILGSGEEEILFRNGSRILFGARERGFGRGFDEIDVLVFDEAQLLSETALDDMVPATNQSRQATGALLLYMGTPPKPTDAGDAFRRMRTEALTGEDDDTGWIEFGADPGFHPTPLPAPLTAADWEQVAKANPSFPADTPRPAILRMRKKLGPESFLREGLGIWDDVDSGDQLFSPERWGALGDPSARIAKVQAFAVEVRLDRSWAFIAASGQHDEKRHAVELIPWSRDPDRPRPVSIGWLLDRCVEVDKAHGPAPWVVDGGGPAGVLVEPMQQAGLQVVVVAADGVKQAAATIVDAVNDGTLIHGPQPEVDDVIPDAVKRPMGDGGFAISRRKSPVDVTSLIAESLALWRAKLNRKPEAYSIGEMIEQIRRERGQAEPSPNQPVFHAF